MLTVQQYAKGATIPQKYLNNAQLTVHIVNEIFSAFPNQFTFNSGYRTPARNAAVGGVANSYHVQALAADITPVNHSFDKYKSALTTIVSKYGWELIDERKKNHFHIEPSGNSTSLSVVDNSQLQPQSNTFLGQFKPPSSQDNTIVVAGVFLILILLLSD
jgi:hypothetical protein